MVKKVIPHPDKTIFSASEACGYLNVCWNTLKSLINAGEIRAIRIRRKYLIPKESIDSFVKRDDLISNIILKEIRN